MQTLYGQMQVQLALMALLGLILMSLPNSICLMGQPMMVFSKVLMPTWIMVMMMSPQKERQARLSPLPIVPLFKKSSVIFTSQAVWAMKVSIPLTA